MKNKLLYIISLCAFLMLISFNAKGTIAYPEPIIITQPDGTTITILMHGDEFLHWTTSNGRLVEKGTDGFYYYASFNEDGTRKISASRVSAGSIVQYGSTVVRPPQAAIKKAKEARRKYAEVIGKSAGTHIGMGEKHFLVLLIEFNDLSFTTPNPVSAISNMLNESGYNENDGTGSVRDYYIDNSLNKFSPTFDVYGPIRVSKGYAHYGENDENGQDVDVQGLLAEACNLIDNEVAFNHYDIDNDGYVDNIFFYFAGHNEAEGGGEDCIWPHQGYVWSQYINLDGVQIYKYACSSEYKGSNGTKRAGIGTFCHEFGHVLGLPDYYDTDYEENGMAGGLWQLSLMSSGNYNNDGKTPPYLDGMSRIMLGWMDALTPLKGTGTKIIKNISTNVAYMTPTNIEGEFYMYENRQKTGWDAYTGTSGLAIYHVDQSNNVINYKTAKQRWHNWDGINAYADHQCFDLIESVYPESAVEYTNDFTFPGRFNKTSFTAKTLPALLSWNEEETGYGIYDITNSGGDLTLRFEEENTKIVCGSVKNSAGYPLPNVNITLTATTEQSYGVMRAMVAKEGTSPYTTITDSDGKFTINLAGTSITTFHLNASLQNYADYNELITIFAGVKKMNIILNSQVESEYTELKKHKDSRGWFGWQDLQEDIWTKVTYFESELTAFINYKFKTIQFEIGGTSANKVIVFIKVNDETILEKVVDKPKFGTPNILDISSDNITIPANGDVSIGYHIIHSDSPHPIIIDYNEPYVSGGGYYSLDGIQWYVMKNSNDIDYFNVIISATIMPNRGMISEKGINYIISPKNQYNTGDIFTFELSKSINIPISVKWYFDNNEINESSTTLTKGEHKIKGVATYPDGNIETLLLEITVN